MSNLFSEDIIKHSSLQRVFFLLHKCIYSVKNNYKHFLAADNMVLKRRTISTVVYSNTYFKKAILKIFVYHFNSVVHVLFII